MSLSVRALSYPGSRTDLSATRDTSHFKLNPFAQSFETLCFFSRNNFSKEGIIAGEVAHTSPLHDLRLADSSWGSCRGKPVELAEESKAPQKRATTGLSLPEMTTFPSWPHRDLTAIFCPVADRAMHHRDHD